MKPLRVLVTGGRRTTRADIDLIWNKLDLATAVALAEHRPVVIVEGRCPYGGADLAAQRWAEHHGVGNEGHPADWKRYGKRAGMIRNAEMVDAGADICVAFPMPGSKGTWDCLQKAADAGIPGRVYPIAGWLGKEPPA